ncbi:tryptophan synthase subunit alpha [Bacillus aquiflavi]|uniref:Tryptophan synthase alpha chain n=1 Tax=Bacillus aquiflavi TaxID=2672567 RepID=A0A6B3W3J5_9BACI|nr:tryptophan synthase subunit alpha [Bacillus aquiflavi]MBA4537156.1 tryptophan synthase subunit alpha [Bacillus aquiflavi]NEY82431.1 tryptophan synthase subunit alpha [Bacillus aquiflavi]
MNKLKERFNKLLQVGEKAFVPYIMAGSSGLEKFKEQLLFLQKSGVTAVEVGIPFSDPAADGETIQKAGKRALEQYGVTLEGVLNFLQEMKNEVTIPIVIMSYVNPIYRLGVEHFINLAQKSGIAGCIIPDLPLEEEEMMTPQLEAAGIELVRLVTLTSSEERIKQIAERGNGFLYAVTVTGITGIRRSFHDQFASYLNKVKQLSPIPVLAGFGISTSEQVSEACEYCDGVIVGSKIIELFERDDFASIVELIEAVNVKTPS